MLVEPLIKGIDLHYKREGIILVFLCRHAWQKWRGSKFITKWASDQGSVLSRKVENKSIYLDYYVQLAECPYPYFESIHTEESDQWLEGMEEEIKFLKENETWDLFDLLLGRKLVGRKWALRKKYDNDGPLNRYKAAIVAQGQKAGIRLKTYSPVTRFDTDRVLLSVAASERLVLMLFDIESTFPNGHFDEEIFMNENLQMELAVYVVLKEAGLV